jgi:hypothetical protein
VIIAQKEKGGGKMDTEKEPLQERPITQKDLYMIANQIVVTILGYALAFFNTPNSDLVFYGLLSLAVVSHLVLALPLFYTFRKSH